MSAGPTPAAPPRVLCPACAPAAAAGALAAASSVSEGGMALTRCRGRPLIPRTQGAAGTGPLEMPGLDLNYLLSLEMQNVYIHTHPE